MRLSDFQLPTENISTPESLALLDRNSTRAGKVVNWRGMRIGMTQGARASDPLRQIGTDANGAAHLKLERLLYKDGSCSASRRKVLHDALDEMISKVSDKTSALFEAERDRNRKDAESYSDSEEAEVDPDDEEEELEATDAAIDRQFQSAVRNFVDVVRRSVARIPAAASRVSSGRSYAQDADAVVVARYLRPEQPCFDAIKTVN
jgi:hypothetical protein